MNAKQLFTVVIAFLVTLTWSAPTWAQLTQEELNLPPRPVLTIDGGAGFDTLVVRSKPGLKRTIIDLEKQAFFRVFADGLERNHVVNVEFVSGSEVDDTFINGPQKMYFLGSGGNNLYVVKKQAGFFSVLDFKLNIDKVDVQDFKTNYQSLKLQEFGGDTLVMINDVPRFRIDSVRPADLTEQQFVF